MNFSEQNKTSIDKCFILVQLHIFPAEEKNIYHTHSVSPFPLSMPYPPNTISF